MRVRVLPATLVGTGGRVEYLVHVVYDGGQRVVCHRFSAFLALHAKVQSALRLPPFPASKALVVTPATIQQRIVLLQRFLDDLLRAIDGAAADGVSAVSDFLTSPRLDAIGAFPLDHSGGAAAAEQVAASPQESAAEASAPTDEQALEIRRKADEAVAAAEARAF